MRNSLLLNFQTPQLIPGGPVTIEGPFVFWAWIHRVQAGNQFLLGDNRPTGTGSVIYVNGTGMGISSFDLGSFTTDQERVPDRGDVLVRVRRDPDGTIFLAFTGQSEFQGHGPPQITNPTFVYTSLGEYYATDENLLSQSDENTFVREIKIVEGVPTAIEMHDYEMTLTGSHL